MSETPNFFRWAAGALLSVVLLFVGGFVGNSMSTGDLEDLTHRTRALEREQAVMDATVTVQYMNIVERLDNIEKRLAKNDG